MMASYRVHCIVVTEAAPEADADERPWRVLSDLDLVRAAERDIDERTAGSFASEAALAVAAEDELNQVVRLMSDQGASHVVVTDRARERPVGVISTLDVIEALAGARS